MLVNVFLLSARHIGIIVLIGLMQILTFKAIIGHFQYWSDDRWSLCEQVGHKPGTAVIDGSEAV